MRSHSSRANLPYLFSAEHSHIQGSFEATGGHVTASCSVNIPYAPVIRSVKRAAHMTKNKVLAARDYVRKPAVQQSKPTKRITPERVSSSPQETESYAELEEDLAEKEGDELLATLGAASNPIYWEPTCPDEERDHGEDGLILQKILCEVDFDDKFIQSLHTTGHQKAAAEIILPALRASCDGLKASLKCYHRGIERNHQQAAADALVFYRRHSPQLEPHITYDEGDFLEGMCNFLLCFLRNAGYHVTHTASQQ